jgi:hypothetical protein
MSCFPTGGSSSIFLPGSDELIPKAEFFPYSTSIFKNEEFRGYRQANSTDRKQHYTSQKYIMTTLRSSNG